MNDPNQDIHPSPKSIELVVIGGGVILFLLLVYTILPVISPFVVVGAMLFLLYPLRAHMFVRRLMWLSVILFTVWFFASVAGVIVPFIVALLVAYILNPLVTYLERKSVKRWMSSLCILVFFLGLIVVLSLTVVPVIALEFNGLLGSVSVIVREAIAYVEEGNIPQFLSRFGVSVESTKEYLSRELAGRVEFLLTSLFEGLFGFVSSLTLVVTQIINIIIIPFLTFYLLKDLPLVVRYFEGYVPDTNKPGVASYVARMDEVLGRYFRGAIVVAVIQGVISTVVLSLLGVSYAYVLGFMTAVLSFIPYIGIIISMAVGIVVALLSGDPVTLKVFGVIVMYLSQKIFENMVLAPKIIGTRVGLHPIALIISLFIFGHFLGFIGFLIAVPSSAVIVMSVQFWRERTVVSEREQTL